MNKYDQPEDPGYIISEDGYIYVYCPACDEIHSVPLYPQNKNGWSLFVYHWTNRKGEKLSGPQLNPCVHSTSKKFPGRKMTQAGKNQTDCTWYVYPFLPDYTKCAVERYDEAQTSFFSTGLQNWQKITPVTEWPEKFQPFAKSLLGKVAPKRKSRVVKSALLKVGKKK